MCSDFSFNTHTHTHRAVFKYILTHTTVEKICPLCSVQSEVFVIIDPLIPLGTITGSGIK